MEPEAKVEVSGDGKSVGDIYSWSGELVGSGELEHLAIEVPKSTDMEIRFKEPWASEVEGRPSSVEPVAGRRWQEQP